jgi:hypothetical protein
MRRDTPEFQLSSVEVQTAATVADLIALVQGRMR